ncbi:MAG: DUF3014 domain-containing protein [Methyloprofundus sp.]|nr:DUF3014 domain-containing protein [Methyloprofundus sp.]
MQEQNSNTPGKPIYWVIAIVVILLLAGVIGFLAGDREGDLSSGENLKKQALVIPEVKTEPLDTAEQKSDDLTEQLPQDNPDNWEFETGSEPLTELKGSDAEYTQDLLAVSAQLKLGLFKNEQIRKTMFSINDMAQGLRPPLKRLREISFSQPFSVTEEEGKMYISAQAYHRYDALAQAINSIDKQGAVALYKKYLPLFQGIFAEFSYPDNYQVLDSIKAVTGKVLQAPVMTGNIEVIRPSVRYKFADPELEKLSALDKQMLRMGPDNTRLIQNKLRELIQALIASE